MTRDELLALQQHVIQAITGETEISGIDSQRIELQGNLAKAKRTAKVESVLPRTCRALGDRFSRLAAEFVEASPPTSFRSRADGLAFYRFLCRQRVPPEYLDLAYCELALSAVGARPVRLHTCAFDVRAFFEGDAGAQPVAVPAGPVHLAILADPRSGSPRIMQLPPATFDFLRAFHRWRVLPDIADESTRHLVDQLQQHGLLEIAR